MSKTDKEIQDRVVKQVISERHRQDELYGDEELYANAYSWLRILVEEVGEVAEAMSDRSKGNLEEELIQVAAVALGWLEDIEHTRAKIKSYAIQWDHRQPATNSGNKNA